MSAIQNSYMRNIFILIGIIVFLFSCSKNRDNKNGICDTLLTIGSTNTPKITTVAAGIKTVVNSYGPDLCYSYAGFGIAQKEGNIFEIKSKGKVNCGAAICAQAIYAVKDSTIIYTNTVGTYYLKFFNNAATSFKTDTVVVN